MQVCFENEQEEKDQWELESLTSLIINNNYVDINVQDMLGHVSLLTFCYLRLEIF